jgi:VanZ family protein
MAPGDTHRPKRLRNLWLWVGYWVTLFAATHVPMPSTGRVPVRYGDKILHFGLYFLLAWLGGRYLRASRRHVSLVLLLAWAAAYTAYAGLDEWLQQFVGRSMSLGDWVADVVGLAAATATLAAARTPTALSEHDTTDR